ncbi:unnamed protein product [Onchocerca flexuosa]|uniref:Uncharacterized protein n=1 Tax=Onchocerca flexuosa TaxID=387005 RepID=A0A183HPX2_9BILA|nr:unnamed protein product [Onchocerca flexuosa]
MQSKIFSSYIDQISVLRHLVFRGGFKTRCRATTCDELCSETIVCPIDWLMGHCEPIRRHVHVLVVIHVWLAASGRMSDRGRNDGEVKRNSISGGRPNSGSNSSPRNSIKEERSERNERDRTGRTSSSERYFPLFFFFFFLGQ